MPPSTRARMGRLMRRVRARGAATPAADNSPTRRASTTSERRPPGRRIPKRVASSMTAAAILRMMLPTPTIRTTLRSIWKTTMAVKTCDLDHDDFGTYLHPLIEVDDVLIEHADAAR